MIVKKKVMVIILCFMLALTVAPLSAAETYTFGFGEGEFTQEENGSGGFWLMFAQQYDTGGNHDVSGFQECIWGRNSVFSLYDGPIWCPSVKKEDTGIFKEDNMWWKINKTGMMMPSNGLANVLKWKAPADGKYKITTVLHGGLSKAYFDHQIEYGAFPTTLEMDGVTCSIYRETEKLFSKNSLILVDGKVDKDLNFFENNDLGAPVLDVELLSGESVYFITDQNAHSEYDNSAWQITIEKTGEIAPVSSSASSSAPSSSVSTPSSSVSQSSSVSSSSLSSAVSSQEPVSESLSGEISSEDEASSEASSAVSEESSGDVSETDPVSETSAGISSEDKADEPGKFPVIPVVIAAAALLVVAGVLAGVKNAKKNRK